MKPLSEIVIGFVVSLGMFVIGLAAATVLLTAEPERQPGPSVDVADLWTAEPRKVDPAAQDFERLPAVQLPPDPKLTAEAQTAATDGAETTDVASEPLDDITTGSSLDDIATGSVQTTDQEEGQATPPNELSIAHVEWCANRYRSYRPRDDSYTSYYGEQRPCVSPYSGELAATAEPPSHSDADSNADFEDDASALQYASEGIGPVINSDHVSYCFSRYRSYRPEDNTYQPYDGGPRRQCR